MQQPDERRPGPSRPSLFSDNPPPAADSTGILSQLDGKSTAAVRLAPRPRGTAKMAAALAFVGLAGGAGAWWMAGAGDAAHGPALAEAEHRPVPAAPATAPAPAAAPLPAALPPTLAAAAPATPAAPALLPPAADGRDVSAATILDGTAAGDRTAGLAQALEAPAAKSAKSGTDGKDEVAAMFDAPAASAKAAAPARAAHTGRAKGEQHAMAEPAKHGTAEKHRTRTADKAKDKSRHVAHRASAARARPKPEKDSDAALLEALLSHSRPANDGARAQNTAKGK